MDKSPLGTLPPELRNRIYELVLPWPTPFKIGYNVWRDISLAYGDEARFSRPTALLRTCIQIRNECRGVFFATNTFELEARNEQMIVEIPRHFLRKLGDKNSAMLRQVSVLYLRNPISMRIGDHRHPQHKILLRRMKELRKNTSHLKNCSIKVIFKSDFYAIEAFSLQGLPLHLTCNLRDFGQPWNEQIDALNSQCEVWKVMSNPLYFEANDACTRLGEMLDHWRTELEKV
jgi:hypothetical protein